MRDRGSEPPRVSSGLARVVLISLPLGVVAWVLIVLWLT